MTSPRWLTHLRNRLHAANISPQRHAIARELRRWRKERDLARLVGHEGGVAYCRMRANAVFLAAYYSPEIHPNGIRGNAPDWTISE